MQQRILLRQIVTDISNLDNYLVYSDYLKEQDDPRGKLIELDYQLEVNGSSQLRKIREQYFESNLDSFLGKLSTRNYRRVLQLEWFMGFVKSAYFSFDHKIPIIRDVLIKMLANTSFILLQKISLCYGYKEAVIIPPEIDKLTNLVSIDLCESTNIPIEFCNLQGLQFISFNPVKFSIFLPEVRDYIAQVMNIDGQMDIKQAVEILKDVVDEYGRHHLVNLNDWSREIATAMALLDGLVLKPSHWEIIDFCCDYYEKYQVAPTARMLKRAIEKKLGEDKGNSKYLYSLFPYGPTRQAYRYAGIPETHGYV